MMESESIRDFVARIREHLDSGDANDISPEFIDSHRYSDNDCVFTWSLSDGEMNFRTGFEQLLGEKDETLTLDRFVSLMHPEEVEYVKRIGQAATTHAIDKPEGNKKWVLYVAHRLRRSDDRYIHVLAQSSPAFFDSNGLITQFVVKLTDISFKKSDGVVHYKFIHPGLDPDAFHKSIFHEIHNLFTEREVEVIALMKQGYNSQKISDTLKISKHTVSTHRKKILKKANCHSSEELLNYCEKNGLRFDAH